MNQHLRITSLILVILWITGTSLANDLPSFRVDINKYGRQVSEGNNTNFLPWTFVNANIVRDTLINSLYPTDTVVVQLRGLTMNNVDTIVWNNYYKAGITSPTVTNDAKLTLDGGFSRIIEMTIHGLPAGQNTLLTYHNNVDAATAWKYNAIRILLDGKVLVDSLMPTVRELNMANVPVTYQTFTVEEGKDVVFRFEPIITQGSGTLKPFNCVPLNGFEINTPNLLHQSYSAYPNDRDEHADADAGTITLKWNKAATAATHVLYLGNDSLTVTQATTASAVYIATKQKNDTTYTITPDVLKKYFWRVDEIATDGTITKGNTWYFRARHLAFRGAEGYGRFAMGGRGGRVVHVTNLNDDGEGSFRQAVTNTNGEARTVVFDVSGIIRLNSRLMMAPNLTIAGQTAPGKGICFRAAPIGVNNDCVCRFIRMRLGGGPTYDGMGMAGVNNGIIDHCSISWTIDEAFSSRNSKNITLQRTLISEALSVAGHDKYPAGHSHGYAGTVGGNTASYHHNLLAHCEGRNFSMGAAIDGSGVYNSKIDMFNNVVYDFGGRANDGQCHQLNFVNNYYKKGPSTSINFTCKMDFENYGTGTLQACYTGNLLTNSDNSLICDGTDKCGSLYTLTHDNPEPTFPVFVDQPFFQSFATIESAQSAYRSVLSNVGCTMPVFDDHDKRIIRETKNGTYTYVGSYTGKPGMIDNEADAGGFEDYGAEVRPAGFDTDGDGLPDWWEKLHNTNVNSAKDDFSDSNADPDKDGYTALEDYLEWMSVPHYFMEKNIPISINLAKTSVNYSASARYTVGANANLSISVKDSVATVNAVTNTNGIYYFNYTVTDPNGCSMTLPIGVCLGSGTTGLNETESSGNTFTAFPSLFRTEFNVSALSTTQMLVEISMQDITGTVVFSSLRTLTQGVNQLSIQCPNNMPSQLYIVQIRKPATHELLYVGRLIKQ